MLLGYLFKEKSSKPISNQLYEIMILFFMHPSSFGVAPFVFLIKRRDGISDMLLLLLLPSRHTKEEKCNKKKKNGRRERTTTKTAFTG